MRVNTGTSTPPEVHPHAGSEDLQTSVGDHDSVHSLLTHLRPEDLQTSVGVCDTMLSLLTHGPPEYKPALVFVTQCSVNSCRA